MFFMYCPYCGSPNVSVQIVQHSARTRNRGCLWGLARLFLVICTCGLWLLIGSAKSKTKMQNRTVAVCQSCGESWYV